MVIFYEVDPTDVKKQAGDFGKVFKKTCKGKKKEVVTRWSQALAEVATISGYHSSKWNNDAKMVEDIATDVSNMLFNSTLSRDFNDFVGMGAHLKKIERILGTDFKVVRMIGIWGPPGIGKTTIARCLFNQLSNSNNFPHRVFMRNVKAMYTTPVCSDDYDSMLNLQQKFLSQITNQKEDFKISHLGAAQERLHDKRVLAVLDNVDHSAQLDAMAKDSRWFGPGSWIIVTTQDKRLLRAHGIEDIYMVNYPAANEALQIFCMNAFRQKSPKDGFEELAQEVTKLAGSNPLGLRVIGSCLRGLTKQEWINELPRLRNNLHGDIESTLKFSYDALSKEEKKLFIHIACFFNHTSIEVMEHVLAKTFLNVRQGLHVLTEKSLISSPDSQHVKMDDLLAQLGREIMRSVSTSEQSIFEHGQCRFLLDTRDMFEVISDDTAGTSSVIGINLKLSLTAEKLCIGKKAFERMTNLQLLKIYSDYRSWYNPKPLKSISRKIRLLEWQYFPMACLPLNFNPEFLVKLCMHHSKLQKLWNGNQPLSSLKWMDLGGSEDLKKLPDLSTATKLESISLRNCSSLKELPCSIGNATNLLKLNLCGCSSLKELPCSIGNATNLLELDLSHCSSLVELPSSIGKLQKLLKLNMDTCSKLKVLPININMESLKKLDVSYCELLENFPEISTNIESLYIQETSIKEIPSSITMWPRLEELWMSKRHKHLIPHGLKVIPFLIGTGPKWSRDIYVIRDYEYAKEQRAKQLTAE